MIKESKEIPMDPAPLMPGDEWEALRVQLSKNPLLKSEKDAKGGK